ncbi:ABC transporter substrate-binding protein [Bradyrhizobium sp. USDA 4486]
MDAKAQPALLDRRRLLTTALAVPVAIAADHALAAPPAATGRGGAETRSLDELYQDALAEGGNLVVYAGGDTPTQQDNNKKGFLARFPKMNISIIVDYSKYHDVRLDRQLADRSVVPDVVQLQTLQNFARWKKEGHLLNYKPAGFSKLHDSLRDPDGAWMAIGVIAFSYMYDPSAVDGKPPASPKELTNPEWRGRIASSYPSDDDAVLFLYKLYAETYGWDWIQKLADQGLQFARGTHSPGLAVSQHQKAVGLGGSGSLTTPANAPVKWAIADGHPFLAWGQRAAIPKEAPHKAAAKLYMNWQISEENQRKAYNGWSVRTDVQPQGGLKPVWDYANSHFAEFPRFMEDRALVERWRQTFAIYFGEVRGEPSPGWLGQRPGA